MSFFFADQGRVKHRLPVILALALPGLLLQGCGRVDDPTLFPEFKADALPALPAKQALPRNPNRNLYWGDLHIHTSLSSDAYIMGVRAIPDDVYRYAKGQAIAHAAGYPMQIDRPLDFAAVTDHAEYLGEARLAELDYPTTRKSLRDILLGGNKASVTQAWLQTTLKFRGEGFGADKPDEAIGRSAWQQTIDAAERHNDPGVFTSFIGYEWSAYVEDIAVHIHRCVIYRDNNVSSIPFSSLDSSRPEDLWAFLAGEESQGRVAIAIPHNANMSKGSMYPEVDSDGKPLTADYAARRNYFEPVSEILQIKGASEIHPMLAAEDEFAGFSIAIMQPGEGEPEVAELKGSYMRPALLSGIGMQQSMGFNPYSFGVIGASDSHNASSPARESDYSGKLPIMDGSAGLRTSEAMLLPLGANPANSWSSGGLAAVWAEENTRTSLFDAMRRKESYATSGPRIALRFFAGWEYDATMLDEADYLGRAYAQGVPMGGQLASPGSGHAGSVERGGKQEAQAPRFLVAALKDPLGANLDRIQIIKGWAGRDGSSHEKIFNVALSGGRSPEGPEGDVAPVGNTVDVTTASYSNTIGAAELTAFWQDPEFDPALEAFYYARVLEIPTPRWSTYDAARLGSKPMQPAVIRERAISSPIWYSAAGR